MHSAHTSEDLPVPLGPSTRLRRAPGVMVTVPVYVMKSCTWGAGRRPGGHGMGRWEGCFVTKWGRKEAAVARRCCGGQWARFPRSARRRLHSGPGGRGCARCPHLDALDRAARVRGWSARCSRRREGARGRRPAAGKRACEHFRALCSEASLYVGATLHQRRVRSKRTQRALGAPDPARLTAVPAWQRGRRRHPGRHPWRLARPRVLGRPLYGRGYAARQTPICYRAVEFISRSDQWLVPIDDTRTASNLTRPDGPQDPSPSVACLPAPMPRQRAPCCRWRPRASRCAAAELPGAGDTPRACLRTGAWRAARIAARRVPAGP